MTAYCNKKIILSNVQVDEKRATFSIPPVPDTSTGNKAWFNFSLKYAYGKE